MLWWDVEFPYSVNDITLISASIFLKKHRILPEKGNKKNICLYINNIIVIWKNNLSDSLLKTVKKVKDNFKNIRKRIDTKNLKKVKKYTFPHKTYTHELDNVLVFDIETYKKKEYAHPFAIVLYDVSRLEYRHKRDLKDDEIIRERNQVIKFKADNGNPVLQMFDYINKNFIDKINKKNKSGANNVKSYKITLIAHKASGFDSYIVMNNLDKKRLL